MKSIRIEISDEYVNELANRIIEEELREHVREICWKEIRTIIPTCFGSGSPTHKAANAFTREAIDLAIQNMGGSLIHELAEMVTDEIRAIQSSKDMVRDLAVEFVIKQQKISDFIFNSGVEFGEKNE